MKTYVEQAKFFRDWLKNVLSEEIGTYQFANGQKTQAIAENEKAKDKLNNLNFSDSSGETLEIY